MRIFKEEQRFTQTWLLVLLAISVIAPLLIITKEYLAEDSTMSNNEFILTLVAISVSIGFIFFFKLFSLPFPTHLTFLFPSSGTSFHLV